MGTERRHGRLLFRLKKILCAGEVLSVSVLRKWMNFFPHVRFTNMYGPTKITVDCCYHIIESIPSPEDKYVLIGLP
ncbi:MULTISPECIES: AMP-binding protein [unclassified Brenneria]|uniref:AMP-binding protein n=1 Tax=unclassified Brenneria TaxID=2634434 RepID=UPI00351C50F3